MAKLVLSILGLFISLFSHSQTGPAGVGSSTNNVLWLKADAGTSSTTNNTRISSWNDQSGNGINVTQTVAVQQPSFATNVMNGMPAIQFDNVTTTNDKLYAPDSPILDNTPGLSIFTVTKLTNVGEARTIISKRNNVGVQESYMLFYYDLSGYRMYLDVEHSTNDRFASTGTYTTNTNYIYDFIYDGTLASANRVRLFNGETLDRTATETSTIILNNNSPLNIGKTHDSDPRPFGGYIAEIITYTTAVNDAQRIIINNYLSSKYDIALSANDKYLGDTPGNGNYDRNVAGIGTEASGSNPTFSATATLGLGISSKSGLGNGDYILVGHSTITNSVIATDITGLSGSHPARWQRSWYIDVTNAGGVIQADVEFDMVAGGMSGTTPVTPSNYKLLYRSGTSGAWTEVATASSISGTKVIFESYNFNSNTDDGYYTIGTINISTSPLPIELLSFDAIMNNHQVDIIWSTATEINNDYYTIEKSKDGIHFEPLSIVDAAGNSSSIINYKDIDATPFEGISYYRLKQTDFNGTFTYSKIVAVNYSFAKDGFTIFPNPTEGEINININDIEQKEVLVVIRDITGKECFSKVIITQENQQLIAIDSEHKLTAGTYIIMASSNNKLYSKKIIVK
jgi:hypothetical protein